MKKNAMLVVVNSAGEILKSSGVFKGLSGYNEHLIVITPQPLDNYLLASFMSNNLVDEIQSQYVIPSTYSPSDYIETDDALYQTVLAWNVFEVDLKEEIISNISHTRSTTLSMALRFEELNPSSKCVSYQGFFGVDNELPTEDNTIGDYYECEDWIYSITSGTRTYDFSKGMYVYWNGERWVKDRLVQALSSDPIEFPINPTFGVGYELDDDEVNYLAPLGATVVSNATRLTNLENTQEDIIDGTQPLDFDNTISGLAAVTVKDAIDEVDDDLDTHIADVANPHEVTKTQVGLGNADNTSDADKPISTAQAAAIQTVQDLIVAGDTNAEVIIARNTYETLKDRLDTEYVNNGKIILNLQNESALTEIELLDSTEWTSTGWTGNFATGFIHTVGETDALSRTMISTGTNRYQIKFTIDSPTSMWDIDVSIGNSEPQEIYKGTGTSVTYTLGITSISDGDLIFTPTSNFDGTIKDISVKQITTNYDATVVYKDKNDNIVEEKRITEQSLYNIFNGINSGQWNTTGNENVVIGNESLSKNTSGFWNVGVGQNALKENTTGSRNTALGYQALLNNIGGQRNVSIGSFSLVANKDGVKNIAVGSDTLYGNTTGSGNIAIGFGSMYGSTTGNYNVGVGQSSLGSNSTGEFNVGVGFGALSKNTNQQNNTAIGARALNISTGANNTAIGFQSGNSITTGANNIMIGYNVDVVSPTDSNKLNIGDSIFGNLTSKYIGIGTTNPGVDSLPVYSGYKLTVGQGSNKGNIDIIGSSNNDDEVVGILGFINQSNDNVGGVTRRVLSYISSTVSTSDSNASGDSGGNLLFYVKDQNQIIAERMRIDNVGRLGIGLDSPTARLHLKAGAADVGKAPLKLSAGINLITPEIGAFEFDGTNLYFTDGTGTRKIVTLT